MIYGLAVSFIAAPDPTGSVPERRRFTAGLVGKLFLSCVFGGLLLYALQRGGVPLVPPESAFAQVKWWTVPVYLVVVLVSAVFRGARWRLLLRPVVTVSATEALSAVLIGSAAILLMPLRLGEMVRPVIIARRKRASVLSVLGTVVAERILDGLVLSSILAASLLLAPALVAPSTRIIGLPVPISAVRGYAWTLLLTFVLAFLAIVVFFWARDLGTRVVLACFKPFSPKLGQLLAERLGNFADGLQFFRHRKLAAQFIFETCVYWALGAFSFWLLGWGTGVVHDDQSVMTFGEACAIMGVLGIATVLPGPPGLLGLFQAGLYAGMTMYYPESVITGTGAAYVFLVYVLQMGFALGAGTVCAAIAGLSARS